MISFNICIPVDSGISMNTQERSRNIIPLYGATHLSVRMFLCTTYSNMNRKNERASKLVSYLHNPCLIHNITINGDCILHVEVYEVSPWRYIIQEDKREEIVLSQIDHLFDEKDIGKIPHDLFQWCIQRMKSLQSSRACEMIDCISHYGEKR